RYTCRLAQKDYLLKITFKDRHFEKVARLCINFNGAEIYSGFPYGGKRQPEYEKKFLPEGYVHVVYKLPESLIKKDGNFIEITEPSRGFMITEFFIVGDDRYE
ncbi:MAG: hypothetical protein IJU45_03640, partial [Clostridia bacterium]|nr:hypothetical protein [Clostridia bacterium]